MLSHLFLVCQTHLRAHSLFKLEFERTFKIILSSNRFPVPLWSLLGNGGQVGCTTFVIQRKSAIVFMERRSVAYIRHAALTSRGSYVTSQRLIWLPMSLHVLGVLHCRGLVCARISSHQQSHHCNGCSFLPGCMYTNQTGPTCGCDGCTDASGCECTDVSRCVSAPTYPGVGAGERGWEPFGGCWIYQTLGA
jgi:hypothetical protein